MSLRAAFIAVTMAAVISCWFGVRAQQLPPIQIPANPPSVASPQLEPDQIAAIAREISQRSEQFKPMFGQVRAADWVAKGAPEAYASQWSSLSTQNDAIEADMAGIAEHPEAMSDIMKALFRLHRFDSDLQELLIAVRRYQNPSLADLIESVAAGDQSGIEKLQKYVLDLAGEKERQLALEDEEAQRCRSTLANQPPARAATPPRKTNGTSK